MRVSIMVAVVGWVALANQAPAQVPRDPLADKPVIPANSGVAETPPYVTRQTDVEIPANKIQKNPVHNAAL